MNLKNQQSPKSQMNQKTQMNHKNKYIKMFEELIMAVREIVKVLEGQ